jgi:DHA1 family bicyclomycin/chloramphenicol resistance-like MFS transporter
MMSRRFLIPFCGVMLALNAFSCDMLLPALAAISRELEAPITRVQGIIPVFLAAAALGQLLFGPASDRFGRRPVLLVGLCLYLCGSLAAALAPSINVLLAARVSQGLGAACGVVLARAILRDTHSGEALAQALALSLAIFAIGPLTAPLIGALIMEIGPWRWVFFALTALGSGLFFATLWRYVETNAVPDPRALEAARMAGAARRVFTHPQSRHFIVVLCLTSCTIIVLISNASRLFQSYGVQGLPFATLFAVGGIGIMIGQLISHRVIGRFGSLKTIRFAASLLLVVATTTALAIGLDRLPLWGLSAYLFAFNMAFLVVMAISGAYVLEPHREIAGIAAALYGSLTQFFGAAVGLALLPWIDGDLVIWGLVQFALNAAIALTVWLYRPAAIAVPGSTPRPLS